MNSDCFVGCQVFMTYNTPAMPNSGVAYEATLLGSILCLSCIPKSEIGPYEFFNNPSSHSKQEHDITESNLWTVSWSGLAFCALKEVPCLGLVLCILQQPLHPLQTGTGHHRVQSLDWSPGLVFFCALKKALCLVLMLCVLIFFCKSTVLRHCSVFKSCLCHVSRMCWYKMRSWGPNYRVQIIMILMKKAPGPQNLVV